MTDTSVGLPATFETLAVRRDGGVLFTKISAPPMNLLGPELVRDLVSLIRRAEADESVRVLVFTSGDPEYFISHVDLNKVAEYRAEAAKLTGEASLGLLFPLCQHQPARHDRPDRGPGPGRRQRVRPGL
jgi:enoyl-CoA hydratase/carnithine racemase